MCLQHEEWDKYRVCARGCHTRDPVPQPELSARRREQSLPRPQVPNLPLPCSSHTPPVSKCLLTLLGNLFSPRLTRSVSSAYGSDKLMKCAERTKRSPLPPSAPCRRRIQTSAAAAKAPKISLAINTVTEHGVCRAKVNTKSAGIFVVLRTT